MTNARSQNKDMVGWRQQKRMTHRQPALNAGHTGNPWLHPEGDNPQ
ncbi:MAG: hypothetical protein Q7T36_17290 [Fluviicoccus sp.]|nr:hypothetical protein [Fluviicoccus sp.]MDO8332223.1 hypothetical protein [Fluviicoccus sp.]